MKKRRVIWLPLVLILLIAGAVYHFPVRNAVKAGSRISDIAVNGIRQSGEAAEQYEKIIKSIRAGKVKTRFAPYSVDDVLYEIDCVADEGNPIHILLGNKGLNVIYSSAPRGYRIHNAQEIIKAVEKYRG